MSKPFLTRPEAAQFLQAHGYPVTRRQLEKLAWSGGGPAYRRFGRRVLYRPDDLLAWAHGKTSAPITSSSNESLGPSAANADNNRIANDLVFRCGRPA